MSIDFKRIFCPWGKIKHLEQLNSELSVIHTQTLQELEKAREQKLCGAQGNGACKLPSGHALPHYNPRGGTWNEWR